MESSISFVLDGRIVTLDLTTSPRLTPTTTLLQYLRDLPDHKGVKEGCAEGDCGACTVVLARPGSDDRLHYRAVDSCLIFLPMIHGSQIITIENLRSPAGTLHPVQQALVHHYGSQCGFCTPGIAMSLFALYKRGGPPSRAEIEDSLSGNLCRCTGYQPIIDAALEACAHGNTDHFSSGESQILALLSSIPRKTFRIQTSRQIYLRPVTMSEAIAAHVDFPDALLINGATDVALRVTKKHEQLTHVIDLSAIPELRRIDKRPDGFVIGAGATIEAIIQQCEADFPSLPAMLRWFGSPQIRTLGTIGGSLGTASPIGDVLPVLMACDARIVLVGPERRREIPATEYVTGYRTTVRASNELISAVILPFHRTSAFVRSYKISKRKDMDISTVSGAFRLERTAAGVVSRIVLAYGGMAGQTACASSAEQFLTGKPWSRESVEQAMPLINSDFNPISDARATAAGRSVMAANLLMKFWLDTQEASHGQ